MRENVPVRRHVCDHDGLWDPHPKTSHGGNDLTWGNEIMCINQVSRCVSKGLVSQFLTPTPQIQWLLMIIFQLVLELAAYHNIRIGPNAYRCCTIYPDDGCLFGVRQIFINIDTLLQVQQQRDHGHEGEHGVQANSKHIQL